MAKLDFGKVAVLMGGWSAEREVSLKSGAAVHQALLAQGIDAYAIDVDKSIAEKLEQQRPDRVFNILHGRGGEDGVIQALLEILEIPYTGSGVLGSALSMDKIRTKQIWNAVGLKTPAYFVVRNVEELQPVIEQFNGAYMVKPSREGSSIGISKVDQAADLLSAWEVARQHDESVLVEQYIQGNEFSVPILNGRALPPILLKSAGAFYDYNAKYISNETSYTCPPGIAPELEAQLKEIALQAFDALSCSGWGRVDFLMDEAQQPWLIENNTLPGMTDHSLVPMSARAEGMTFEELVVDILAATVEHDA